MSIPDIQSFEELNLLEPLLRALREVGYESPSPIQAQSIPALLEGRDVLGQAQTGTGKTAAFALPALQRLDLQRACPQVLVLAPTRELAIQVSEAFKSYARHLDDFHVLSIYGGASMTLQLRQLKRGPHVIVGTPGRVMDHLRRGSLVMDNIQTIVLDEADEMLKMGFIDDVEWVLDQAPEQRQIVLFSATMPDAIRKVTRKHLRNPVEVKIEAKSATVDAIDQSYWLVNESSKLDALTGLLEIEDFDAMIIFVRTKTATTELADKLEARGYSAAPLNGDMNQAMRERTIERLKQGTLDIAIATDVAARGLDVERITHVINYDIPYDTEAYIHRIGRTGRAGRKGTALLLVTPRERRMLHAIERATRRPINEKPLPTGTAVIARRIEVFQQRVASILQTETSLDVYREAVNKLAQELEVSVLDIAAATAWHMQRDRPFVNFHPAFAALSGGDRPSAGNKPRRPRDAAGSGQSPQGQGRERERSRGQDGDFRERRPPRSGAPGFSASGGSRRDDEGKPRRRELSPVSKGPQAGSVQYRLDVGKQDGATPRDIVGAIANEGGIPGHQIGQIRLFDTYGTIDLPSGLSRETLRTLKRIWVRNKPLRVTPMQGGDKDQG
jgi:ATP-dependent RNA helicase DeaD